MKKAHALSLPLLAGLLLLAGCETSTTSSSGNGQSAVTGRMEGDPSMAKRAAGTTIQGVTVTAFAINADGSQGAQIGKDTTDAQGNFQIQTNAQGGQNWMIVATQGTMQWMTRFNDTLAQGEQDTARPINLQSTLLTQVYLALQKTDAGKAVLSGEMTAALDANVAASNRAQYEADDSLTRTTVITHLAAAIMAQSQARAAYLSHSNVSTYVSDTASAGGVTRRAEKILNVALYNADEDSAKTRQVENAYLQAVIAAYGKSDSAAISYARSNEAAYHATLAATALYADSTKNSLRRRLLHVMAMASDTAIQREFARANASQFQLQAVVTAGTNFRGAVDTSRTDVSRDSVTSRYRTAIRAVFQSQGAVSDSSFIAILNLSATVPLSTSLHGFSTSLESALATDATGTTGVNASGMGVDFQNYTAQAVNAILQQWQGNAHKSSNDNDNFALAQIIAFLSVSSNSSHNGT